MAKKLSFSIAVNLLTENFKKGANTVKNSFKSMQMQIITFAAALGAGGLGLAGLVTRFKDVARETSRVLTALKNVSGGTREFADNLRFTNNMAKKYGLEVNALTGNFAKFTASATQANMPMEQQRKVFESLSRASSAFGLSAEDTNGVFLALSQMMGKGKISSEELRKQMGERIPIAMQAMAKAAGVSMAGLEKLLKQGKLMSSDMIPKFADALSDMIPNIDTDNSESSLKRLSNTFGEIVNSSGFQGKYKALIDGLNTLLKSASENVQNIVIGAVAAIGFVVTNGLTKVYRGYAATGKQIIANTTTTHNKLRNAILAKVEARKKLEELELQHSTATGQKQLRLAKQIEAQKQTLSARTVQVNAAHENAKAAAAEAAVIKSKGVWATAYATISGSAKKLAASIKSMWNSFAPAIIISGLIAIGGQIKKLYAKTNALKKLTEDYNTDVEKERVNISILFNRLRDATKGTDKYNQAKNEILSKYGEYLKGLSDEIKSLEDVEGAYKAISAAALQAAKDRAIESGTTEATDDYLKTYKKQASGLKQTLEKELTKIAGSSSFDSIIDQLVSSGRLNNSAEDEIDALLATIRTGDKSAANRASSSVAKIVGDSLFDGIIDQLNTSGKLNEETQSIVDSFSKKIVTSYGDEANDTHIVNGVALAVETIKSARKTLDGQIEEITSLFGKPSAAPPPVTPVTPTTEDEDSEKRLAASRKLDEKDRKRQIDKQKFDLEMRQREIDLMDDSFEKRTKQTLLNLEKEKLQIEEHQNDMLKQQTEYAKELYKSVNGDGEGFEEYFAALEKNNFKNASGADVMPEGLRPADIKKQVDQLTDAAQESQKKGLADINRDLSAALREQEVMYVSNLERRLAESDAYWEQELIKAKGKGEETAELIAQIEANRKRERLEIETDDKVQKLDFDEQLEIERAAGLESIGMTELVEEKKLEITRKYLQLRIDALQALADAGNEDAKNQIKLYQQSLKKLDATKPPKSLKALADGFVFNKIKKGFLSVADSAQDAAEAEAEAEEKTTSLLSSISQNAGTVANIVSEMQSVFGGMHEPLDNMLSAVGNIASGFASGGVVGGVMAVIGEGMKLFNKSSEEALRHQQALKEVADARLATQRSYNLLLREQNLLMKEAVNIFGEYEIARAVNAVNNYRDSIKDVRNELKGHDYSAPSGESGIRGTSDGSSATVDTRGQTSTGTRPGNGGYVTNGTRPDQTDISETEYRKSAEKYGADYAQLGLATIETRDGSYKSILDEYSDVIDAEGKLNTIRIQSILDTREMSDATRAYLENLIKLEDAAAAAQEELKNYLQSTFGSLGGDLMESLVSAIKNDGVSAWEEFGKAGSKVLEKLGSQIAYQLFLGPKFKQLQSDLEAAYGQNKSDEEIARDAMNLVGDFYNNVEADMDAAQAFMENWQAEAAKRGFNDVWKADDSTNQTASSGRFESMDQDTGNRLDGRFAAMVMIGVRVEGFVSTIAASVGNISNITASISDELHNHTIIFNEMRKIQLNSFYEVEGTKEILTNISDVLERIDKNTSKL